ncbi:MAG TPA: ATP-binding protein [Longimicrobiales bacterium]|nr:ATP-binding protein [Longimicrobiales bacterium]
MPAVSAPTDASVAEILERLARARDLAEACSVVLDRIARETGLAHVALAVRADDGLHAEGIGVDQELLERLREDTDAILAARLEAAIDAEPGSLVDRDVAALVGGGSVVAVPFRGGEGARLGLVLLPEDEPKEGGAVEYVAALLARCGPAIGQCLRIQQTGGRSERLDRQRDLLSTIINALADPVLLTDSQSNILLTNRRAEQLFSIDGDASPGLRRAVQVNNLLFSSFLTRTVIGTGGAAVRELNLVDPTDGSDLLFEVLAVPMPLAMVGTGSIISILRDITDLKRAVTELENQFNRSRAAEHRARRERDQLDVILENVGDPILVTDDKSSIILMNKEAERLFVAVATAGAESRERRSVRANDTKFTTLISDFLLQPDQRRVEKLSLSDPDNGKTFPAEAMSSKILNSRGEPTAIVSVLHDLTQVAENVRLATELKNLNEQLEERIRRATQQLAEHNRRLEWQSRELEKASRLKSEFLASMSHELRTPINVVLGYTSLLREEIYGVLTPQQSEALEKIFSTSQHLLDLINDILDLSRIEAGKMPVHAEEVRIEDIVRDVSDSVEPLVRIKGLEFRPRVDDHIPPLYTDGTKVKQVLLNLLSNAVKFTQEGEIRLEVTRAMDLQAIKIIVADSGIGIREEDLQTIFDDFRQVDQSSTREYGGTGLGLSITKKLLSLLGGTISVRSTYGSGATFTVHLPLNVEAGTVDEQVHRAMTEADRTVVSDAAEDGVSERS